jgi:hypothetical protein
MHGTLKLPGSSRKCSVPGMEPEGADCPVCRGARRVMMTRTFEPLTEESSRSLSASREGGVGAAEAMPTESQPLNNRETDSHD